MIAAIWVLVFFSILSLGVYAIVSAQLRLARAFEERLTAPYLAKSAALSAQAQRASDKTQYDTLYTLQQTHGREMGDGAFTYRIVDEERRINLNASNTDTLSRLPGFTAEIAQRIGEYPHKPFHATEELRLLDGVTEAVFAQCHEYVTVFGQGRVNINTAGPQVLSALGLDDGLIQLIQGFRSGPDGEEGTEDDGAFEAAGSILETLRQYRALTTDQETQLVSLQGVLTVLSENLALQISTTLREKPALKYEIVIDQKAVKSFKEL
ncbi:MAG: hypothetical protein A3D28_05260 [Omnitrophica bacterium RIFCSPHIGHO2_02_FULL_63_14]|nr:MAG: hypothetical protein A3D28_05260 [Omnitrophica bacterium RIFCSPHIGHO2_02_FULL_63_14]